MFINELVVRLMYSIRRFVKCSDPPSFFNLVFRIVRVEVIPDKYEVLITNLPIDSFPPEKIKFLY